VVVHRKLLMAGRVVAHALLSGCVGTWRVGREAIQSFVRRASAVRRRFDFTLGVGNTALRNTKKKKKMYKNTSVQSHWDGM